MPNLSGMQGDVFFGDAVKPLPDWRKEKSLSSLTDDDAPLTPEEREAFIGMLGFDPDEM